MMSLEIAHDLKCFHCGIPITTENEIKYNDKLFCCVGCKSVYGILSKNELYKYYDIDKHPGISPSIQTESKYAFLDDPAVTAGFIDFSDGDLIVVNLRIPQMHCSSCIWLLENMQQLHKGILFSRVDFLRKILLVRFNKTAISFRQIVELLASIGYEPALGTRSENMKQKTKSERKLYLKIGVSAFCFGNIMLLSLPEYFSASIIEPITRSMFGYINLFLSLPVVFFSSLVFFSSAINGLNSKIINIDLPIALGIAIVFIRSAVEVLFKIGPGYFDSLSGLVFFLLLGRLFQNKTYESLSFERQYQSYFPLAVAVRRAGKETTIPITVIRPGERMIIRNNEIIPCDSVLMVGTANIDYSFVTGESRLVVKNAGDLIYAGGKHFGSAIELEAVKETSESEFMQMWNEFGISERNKSHLLTLSDSIGKYFTLGILLIAFITTVSWWYFNPNKILDAVSAILIVACPCAIALAAPFVFGSTQRLFGEKGFYLKHSSVIEAISKIDTIVFDKTGTITQTKISTIQYFGKQLTDQQKVLIASLMRSSIHPLSRSIYEFLNVGKIINVSDFEEIEGHGISGKVKGISVRAGSAEYTGYPTQVHSEDGKKTKVFAAIDDKLIGRFEFENLYRSGVDNIFNDLGSSYKLSVLSGDDDRERNKLEKMFTNFCGVLFNQKPMDKLAYIKLLQEQKKNVMMIGDGLNDAGALWQSDVAIAVSEDVSAFSPACDAILNASSFGMLQQFIQFATTAKFVVYWSFGISIMYNIMGLYFAVRGELLPIFAAILMPLSSITVVSFSTFVTRFLAKRKGLS